MLLTGSLPLLVAFTFPYKLFILSARKLDFDFAASGIKHRSLGMENECATYTEPHPGPRLRTAALSICDLFSTELNSGDSPELVVRMYLCLCVHVSV